MKGKPFFPYAVLKDGLMACIVMVVIIAMAIILGAELGPKADPTSTTVTPRPEWYFFFLFELLRIIKPPELVFLATIGIPTIWLVLLLLLPFYDRNPERHPLKRPIATTAGVLTILTMAFLTIEGALAGSPTDIEMEVAPHLEEGKAVAASSGCLGCHRIGENGNSGPGPDLSNVRPLPPPQATSHPPANSTATMPPYPPLRRHAPPQFDHLVQLPTADREWLRR